MFKLYLGCAIPFGERKPYVDISDPSHTCLFMQFILSIRSRIQSTVRPEIYDLGLNCYQRARDLRQLPISLPCVFACARVHTCGKNTKYSFGFTNVLATIRYGFHIGYWFNQCTIEQLIWESVLKSIH